MEKIVVKLFALLFASSLLAQEDAPVNNSNQINWTSHISYDLFGNTLSKGINYFDVRGKAIQQQSWDPIQGKIWASEQRYDYYGRPAIQTLSAPINVSGFGHFSFFMLSTVGQIGYDDYDTPATLFSPPIISTQPSTLGWYYSALNTDDNYQDITNYPYTRNVYSKLNPQNTIKVLGGNKVTIGGNTDWVQTYAFTMPAEKPDAVNDPFYLNFDNKEVIKSVSRDAHGIETVAFTDKDGNTLGGARSGNEHDSGLQMRQVYSDVLEVGYVDIHVPVGCGGTVILDHITSNSEVRIFDLITESVIHNNINSNTSLNFTSGFYRIEDKKNHYGKNHTDSNPITPIRITYTVNYYDLAVNHYDIANRLTTAVQPIGLSSAYQYNSFGQLLNSVSPDTGTSTFKYRSDGQIRFSQNAEQAKNNSFSYTNYDQLSRPIESGVYKGTGILYANLDAIVNNADGLPITDRLEQLFVSYDEPDLTFLVELAKCNLPSPEFKQTFLSGNVSYTYTQNPLTTKTWYSYDVYGRTRFVVQKIPELECLKTIEYVYSPENGSILKVDYQRYGNDRFVHRYQYNAAGQMEKAEISIDGINFDEQAKYTYNTGGNLARTLLGNTVQGIDYVYNLNGQLKAINHPTTLTQYDPGNDGANGVAQDVFGMAIDYHDGDYKRTNALVYGPTSPNGVNQYNGNIKATRWNTPTPSDKYFSYLYQYNKNNWMTDARWGAAGLNANVSLSANENFREGEITYDSNGNILSLKRNGFAHSSDGVTMDDFDYHYDGNRLKYIEDGGDCNDPLRYGDIKDQSTLLPIGSNPPSSIPVDNYVYDDLGQTTFNLQDKVAYEYNASGLVTKISTTTPLNSGIYSTLQFYDYENTGDSDSERYHWNTNRPTITSPFASDNSCPDYANYPSDLALQFIDSGITETKLKVFPDTYTIIDLDLLVNRHLFNPNPADNLDLNGNIDTNLQNQQTIDIAPVVTVRIKDALQNVIYTKIYDGTAPQTSYCTSYYGEHFNYGFTTNATDGHIILEIERSKTLTFVPDTRLKQRVAVDNIKVQAATQIKVAFEYNGHNQRVKKKSFISPIHTVSTFYVRDLAGNPLAVYAKTITGAGDEGRAESRLVERTVYGLGRIGIYIEDSTDYTLFELTDHLGNVRAVVRKIGGGVISLTNRNTYYPFGMSIPNQKLTDGTYRYEFQGQERDGETGMEAFELRLWDGRIGRWQTIDPYRQHASPYLGMGNNPVSRIDADGGQDGDPPSKGFYAWVKGLFIADPIELDAVNVYSKPESKSEFSFYDIFGFSSWANPTSENAQLRNFLVYSMDHYEIGLNKLRGAMEWIPGMDAYFSSLIDKKHGTAILQLGTNFIPGGRQAAGAAKVGGSTLKHYTTEAGYKAIMETGEILPSIGLKNARHGSGQYFTDIVSTELTSGQVSRKLFGVPWNSKKLTHFIEIDVSNLNVIKNGPNNFVVPGANPLPLNGRLVNHGPSIFKPK